MLFLRVREKWGSNRRRKDGKREIKERKADENT
jgi:hypothetical protein